MDVLITSWRAYIYQWGRETSRDFCFVSHAVQTNLLAATTLENNARNQVYNVAKVDRTILNALFILLRASQVGHSALAAVEAIYRSFRAGAVGQAQVSKARCLLGYLPTQSLTEGVAQAMPWYVAHIESLLRSKENEN